MKKQTTKTKSMVKKTIKKPVGKAIKKVIVKKKPVAKKKVVSRDRVEVIVPALEAREEEALNNDLSIYALEAYMAAAAKNGLGTLLDNLGDRYANVKVEVVITADDLKTKKPKKAKAAKKKAKK